MSLLNKLKIGDELPEKVVENILIHCINKKVSRREPYFKIKTVSYISNDYVLMQHFGSKYNYILLNYTCRNPLP